MSAAEAVAFKFTSGDETSSNDNVCSTYRFSDWAISNPAGRRFRRKTRRRPGDLMTIHIMPNDERSKLQMGEDKDQTNDGRNETRRRLDGRRDKVGKLEEDVARRRQDNKETKTRREEMNKMS